MVREHRSEGVATSEMESLRPEVRSAEGRSNELCSQASEGMWGMPGHTEARKAVVSCDKLGGAAHTH